MTQSIAPKTGLNALATADDIERPIRLLGCARVPTALSHRSG